MKQKFVMWLSGLATVMLAAILVTGCGQPGNRQADDGTTTTTTGTAAGTADGDTIAVGVIVPLSGDLASYGASTLDGIKFRVQEINEAGGLGGKQIVLKIEDNKGDQGQTITSYKKLTGPGGVSAVIGPITSTNSLAVLNDVTSAQCPTISPTATNDTVAPGSDYMFRACYKDSFQGEIVANYASGDLGIQQAAVLVDKGSDYSIGLANSFKKAFTAAGGQVVAEESYKQKDTEYGAKLAKIKDSGAELVFLPGYPGETPLILRQAEVMGLDAKFCGADGWDHPDTLQKSGDKIVGSFIVGAFSPEDQRPEVQEFLAKMKGADVASPGSFEALGYDSMSLIAKAIETHGSSRAKITEGLLAIEQLPCVTGAITITAEGDAVKAAVVMGIEKAEEPTAEETYVKKYLKTVQP